ncbi:hypothetical protein ACFX13_028332 [Malus domestica]
MDEGALTHCVKATMRLVGETYAFGPGLAVNDHRIDFMLPEAPVVGEKLVDEACLAGRKECTMAGHLENSRQPFRRLRRLRVQKHRES